MVDRVVEVETGLDQRAGATLVDGRVVHRQRRARTRFVDKPSMPKPPREPEVGDPWEPLTVRARLHRLGWVLRQDPRPGLYGREPEQIPSCMPAAVREVWKDQPGEPMRRVVPAADQDVVNKTLTDLLRFKDDDEGKGVIYAIIEKTSGEDLGRTLGCSANHARTLIKRMLDGLAKEWNSRYYWRPDARDVDRAKKLIHRNIK